MTGVPGVVTSSSATAIMTGLSGTGAAISPSSPRSADRMIRIHRKEETGSGSSAGVTGLPTTAAKSVSDQSAQVGSRRHLGSRGQQQSGNKVTSATVISNPAARVHGQRLHHQRSSLQHQHHVYSPRSGQRFWYPPIITHTAATPQGSPLATDTACSSKRSETPASMSSGGRLSLSSSPDCLSAVPPNVCTLVSRTGPAHQQLCLNFPSASILSIDKTPVSLLSACLSTFPSSLSSSASFFPALPNRI